MNNIRYIFIEINKGTLSDENINMYYDKHKHFFTEMNNAYRCMRTIKNTDELISKTKDHICKTMLLWRELKLHVTPSAILVEDHIVRQMKSIVGG